MEKSLCLLWITPLLLLHKDSSFFFVYFVITTALLCPGKQAMSETQRFHIEVCRILLIQVEMVAGRLQLCLHQK